MSINVYIMDPHLEASKILNSELNKPGNCGDKFCGVLYYFCIKINYIEESVGDLTLVQLHQMLCALQPMISADNSSKVADLVEFIGAQL